MSVLKPRAAHVVIYQGDDMPTLTELRRAAEAAQWSLEQQTKGTSPRIGDDPKEAARNAQDAYNAFIDEAAERALVIELHSIGRRRFRDLMAAHPPRMVTVKDDPDPDTPDAPVKEREELHEVDASYGINVETFPAAFLTYIDPDDPTVRTVAAPEFTSSKAAAVFFEDEIADGDYDQIWNAAYLLNRMSSSDPKASRYSTAPRSSTET